MNWSDEATGGGQGNKTSLIVSPAVICAHSCPLACCTASATSSLLAKLVCSLFYGLILSTITSSSRFYFEPLKTKKFRLCAALFLPGEVGLDQFI